MDVVGGMSLSDILGFLLEALYRQTMDLGMLQNRYGLGYVMVIRLVSNGLTYLGWS